MRNVKRCSSPALVATWQSIERRQPRRTSCCITIYYIFACYIVANGLRVAFLNFLCNSRSFRSLACKFFEANNGYIHRGKLLCNCCKIRESDECMFSNSVKINTSIRLTNFATAAEQFPLWNSANQRPAAFTKICGIIVCVVKIFVIRYYESRDVFNFLFYLTCMLAHNFSISWV